QDQRGIGEAMNGTVVPAAGPPPALAIGVVDRGRAAVSGQERRLHIAARADAAGAARCGGRHPDRRMRLLIGARPNIDVAVMEEPTLVAHRSVVAGPGLDDEVPGLPLPPGPSDPVSVP